MLGFVYQIADNLRHHARQKRWSQDQATGRRGEDIAHRFLRRAGIVIVARNYRVATGSGEIDLIGWDHDRLVFIEVKARHTDAYGEPDRAIGLEKKRSLVRAARDYARRSESPWAQVRFDVVNVLLTTPPKVSHFRNVIGPGTV